MATITTALCNSYKQEILSGGIHASGDVYKYVLIATAGTGTYGASTTNVGTPGTGAPSTSNLGTDAVAVSGGYNDVAGITLAGFTVTQYNNVTTLNFTDPAALASTTINASGLIIYNSSKANRAVAVYLFTNAPVISTNGDFNVNFPASGEATSLIRLN
jgi:hypothetical protein